MGRGSMPGTAATQALPVLSVQGASSASWAGLSCSEPWGGHRGSLPQLCQLLGHRAPSEVSGRQAGADSACTARC